VGEVDRLKPDGPMAQNGSYSADQTPDRRTGTLVNAGVCEAALAALPPRAKA